jgi:hypothetical protein
LVYQLVYFNKYTSNPLPVSHLLVYPLSIKFLLNSNRYLVDCGSLTIKQKWEENLARPLLLGPSSLTTTISHTHLCHTLSFTHIFVNHHLSHNTLSTAIFHTHFCQPPSLTHIFVTHHLSHIFVNHHLSHGRRGTGVALADIYLRFTWHAWRLVTSTSVSRGRRSTW